MKNLIYLEAQSNYTEHLSFNVATINATKLEAESVYICGHKSHLQALKPLLEIKSILLPIELLPKGKIKRVIQFFKNFIFLSRIKGNSELIILSISTIQLVLAPLYLLRFKKIVIYHHGLAENLLSTNILVRLIFRLIYSYLGALSNIKNIFLGGHARESLNRIGFLKRNFHFQRLPYEPQVVNQDLILKKRRFKVITFGLQTFEKGFLDNLWIWHRLRDYEVECQIVGFANASVLSYLKSSNINLNLSEKMYAQQKLILEIESADIVFFTYPKNLYRLTSSGAYFDALSFQKKILAYSGNEFFEYEKNLNKDLLLCVDKDEMLKKILSIFNETRISGDPSAKS